MDRFVRLLAVRDAALARGDRNLAAAAQAELSRLGYVEASVPEMALETATPKRPRGRPRKTPG